MGTPDLRAVKPGQDPQAHNRRKNLPCKKPPIGTELLAQLEDITQRFEPPPIARLHVPADLCESAAMRDTAFFAIVFAPSNCRTVPSACPI